MKRSKFSLSHHKLFTANMGELVPIGLMEVLPGDTIQHATSALVRCAPLTAPVMHPTHAYIHHWFVPHRLVWDSWEDFITGGPDGEDDSAFPYITTPADTGFAVGSLADYLGVPPTVASRQVSALPFRGYALIWNEWYRDQDLQTELVVAHGDGSDTTTSVALQNCAWEKDYFTSARPWTQKGPEVTLPLTGDAPVVSDAATAQPFKGLTSGATKYMNYSAVNGATFSSGGSFTDGEFVVLNNPTGLSADLSSVTATSINTLREAFALQRYEEARARYGSRYTEYLRYLGIRSSDARLQRPEYLGGGKQTIQFSEVLQTGVGEDEENVVGTLRGHGIGAMRSNRYRRFIEEHGYVFSFMSVKPKTMYAQGLFRTWNRRTKEEFFQKELQHIGQQAVKNKEVYFPHATPEGTFGYQDRYDDYRRMESSVAGEFRTSLDNWHFARIFGSDPSLNAAFVKSVPTKEPFADQSSNVLQVMASHSIQARRIVAKTGSSFIF